MRTSKPFARPSAHGLAGRTRRVATGLLGPAVLAGCGAGSGEGLDVAGRPLAEGGDVALAPTLESIQVNVFDAACVVCHSGAAAPQGLRLDAQNSFTNLVGVPSQQVGSLLRVAPGNPDASYLVQKLEGTAATGARMPLGGPPIPEATIAFVRQWIADGAAPAGTASAGTSPVIVSMSPLPGGKLTTPPSDIVIGFSTAIDASTVNARTFLLDHGGVGTPGEDMRPVPVSVAASPWNPRVVLLGLEDALGSSGTYRLTVRGSGPNVVLSLDAIALDGESGASLPSGNAVEGGDFVVTFDVDTAVREP